MPPTNSEMREFVRNAQFKELFIKLGWDNVPASQQFRVSLKDKTFDFKPIAHKRGFVVLLHESPSFDYIPDRSTGLKIENKLTSLAAEHLIIFTDTGRTRQVWQWSRRAAGSPTRISRETYFAGSSGERIAQRLGTLFFSLEEEDNLTIADVSRRAEAQFRERITRRFYDSFKAEHEKFSKCIEGIVCDLDRDQFASLTLNRLMFVYFVQSKGFLNDDKNYLRGKLDETRREVGRDMFYAFYESFLVRFFHEGLGESDHSPELVALIGKVPYLNGGLFERHSVEVGNTIAIPDEAFEKIFDFFDDYDWHLDDRPLKDDRHINPEVLGYIFEKFINQKQMGAYYTKEDITEYISKNTVIPFLFDRAKEKVNIAFHTRDGIWKLLREDPDRYIYDAVRKGVIDTEGNIVDVPADIAAGIEDVSRRTGWNRTADTEFGLPTETWREYIARRQRCLEIREKLSKGEVYDINDLITYNLDIRRFAEDVIFSTESPDLVKAFYHSIAGRIPERPNERFEYGVSILDPTCGSGAFLFAALKILEPLLSACLDRIEDFVEDEDRLRPESQKFAQFRRVLDEIEKHPNRKYFILKSIIVNNLFGVDIMPDAVEICKLRLFLTLVGEVDPDKNHKNYGLEPLPDIDFNIRSGNTLVGFATEKQVYEAFQGAEQGRFAFDNRADDFKWRAEQTASKYEQFRLQQVREGGEISHEDKASLTLELRTLSDELDIYTAHEYGIDETDEKKFTQFLASHQPFHWYSEFYSIIANGGFEVVIGNPPYLETNEIDYVIKGLPTAETRAVHAACIERSTQILSADGCMSMIVPLALVSTQRMRVVQQLLEGNRNAWYSNYAWRPGKLFDTVNRALTIFAVTPASEGKTFANNYQKWYSDGREAVFPTCVFVEVSRERDSFWVPKVATEVETSILEKVVKSSKRISSFVANSGDSRLFYRTTGGLYWKVFTDFPPAFVVNGVEGHSTRETWITVLDRRLLLPIVALLSSNLFWWWYTLSSNLRDLNPSDVHNFPVADGVLNDRELTRLGAKYISDLKRNSTMLIRQQRQTGRTETQSFKIQLSKPIIDEIDTAIAEYYGLDDNELDFIINYDIKYRMGVNGDT